MAEHTYRGNCPDPLQPDANDPECAACREHDALRKDAERYRHLFDCPEPFCYRGEVYDTKIEADSAIDAAMREQGANN